MKPKIKTRLANLVAKLAGSDDYDPNIKPITPLEYYIEQYASAPVPVINMPDNSFLTGTTVTIENADLLASRIVAHQQVIVSYAANASSSQLYCFNCHTTTGKSVYLIKLSYYRPALAGVEVKLTGDIRYYVNRHTLEINIHVQ